MLRHTFTLACFMFFSSQFLHTADHPFFKRTGEPRRKPVKVGRKVIDITEKPINEGLRISFEAILQALETTEKVKIPLPSSSTFFCPVHGIFESPEEMHVFTSKNNTKMSLKKITAENAQSWISESHSDETRKKRTMAIKALEILGYNQEAKELTEKIFSHTWICFRQE